MQQKIPSNWFISFNEFFGLDFLKFSGSHLKNCHLFSHKKIVARKNTRSISQRKRKSSNDADLAICFIIHRFTTNTQAKIWVFEIPRWWWFFKKEKSCMVSRFFFLILEYTVTVVCLQNYYSPTTIWTPLLSLLISSRTEVPPMQAWHWAPI